MPAMASTAQYVVAAAAAQSRSCASVSLLRSGDHDSPPSMRPSMTVTTWATPGVAAYAAAAAMLEFGK